VRQDQLALACAVVRGHAGVQLDEALCYKPDGRGFDSGRCQWRVSFRPHHGPGVDSASNRNKYQKYNYFLGGKSGRCMSLTILPPSYADCLEIWEPQPVGNIRAVHASIEIALTLPLPLVWCCQIMGRKRGFCFTRFTPLIH
jgi:hypothetical protein